MFACTCLLGSASGVTVMVTLSGCGGVAGAVYTAVFSSVAPPADCLVVTVSTRHALPTQPLPLKDQFIAVLGLEPATGVSTATSGVLVPTPTFPGAVNCKVK